MKPFCWIVKIKSLVVDSEYVSHNPERDEAHDDTIVTPVYSASQLQAARDEACVKAGIACSWEFSAATLRALKKTQTLSVTPRDKCDSCGVTGELIHCEMRIEQGLVTKDSALCCKCRTASSLKENFVKETQKQEERT